MNIIFAPILKPTPPKASPELLYTYLRDNNFGVSFVTEGQYGTLVNDDKTKVPLTKEERLALDTKAIEWGSSIRATILNKVLGKKVA